MKFLIYLMLLLPICVMAQDEGVRFDHELNWKEIQTKAKAENKHIFVDVFATWCGPCVYMSKNVFTTKEAGDFFNKNFVNVKIQMDETEHDDAYVKAWREDAKMIAETYGVKAYPTFLYFSPDGKLVHKVVGGGDATSAFIVKSKRALHPATQYYTVLNNFNKKTHKVADDYKMMAIVCEDVLDNEKAAEHIEKYLETQKDLFTKDNLELVDKYVNSSKGKGFEIFLKDAQKVDAVLGNRGFAMDRVEAIIQQEVIVPKVKWNGPEPDWSFLQSDVEALYPGVGQLLIEKTKLVYYNFKKDWTNFLNTANNLIENNADRVSAANLLKFATYILKGCSDEACLTSALGWIKQANQEKESMNTLLTYAGILYKLGEKDAIPTMEKALVLSDNEQSKAHINDLLAKMKNGEIIWKN